MSMRIIVYGLLTLLVLIQYPLWIGKGGWLHYYDLDKQVHAQEAKNQQLELRNAKIAGDVLDLKEGSHAIEERARMEHGMVKDNEILVQIIDSKEPQKPRAKTVVPAPKVASTTPSTPEPEKTGEVSAKPDTPAQEKTPN